MPKPQKSKEDKQKLTQYMIKCMPEWLDWAQGLAEHCGVSSLASLIASLLTTHAVAMGFRSPPSRFNSEQENRSKNKKGIDKPNGK